MCGPTSAIGLDDAERALYPQLKDLLREPGTYVGLMRGVLAEDAEVAAVVCTTPEGRVHPRAILVTPFIREELDVEPGGAPGERRSAKVGDYDAEVILGTVDGRVVPIAVLASPWINEHLALYARQLWYRRRH